MSPSRGSQRPIRLAGEEIGDHRHVCMLVDGPDEAYDALLPFIVEGLQQGDRVFHIVDPNLRDGHLERLRESGIDTPGAMTSDQLEVQTWNDAYLKGARFDRSAQVAYVLQHLAEGPALGYPRTRLIGSMEWASDADTERELVRYEARLDELLRKRSDVVVCTYDLNRHSARAIADILGLHAAAIVGGELRTSGDASRPSARERLLAAASELFHEKGIQATGVDSIIKEAGVAKATFYRHFPSKDDLVVAWLRDPRARWFDRVRARTEGHRAKPADAIPLFFEGIADWLEAEDYRGCPYLNSAAEITSPAHPARLVIREYLQEIEDYLTSLAAAAGYRDPRMLGMELQALAAGAISLAVARRSSASALTAREAVLSLLATAERE